MFFLLSNHLAENFREISIDRKKEILKNNANVFCAFVLDTVLRIVDRMRLKICSGKHNETICFKSDSIRENKICESAGKDSETTDTVVSVVPYKKNKILLQTCAVKIESNSMEISRLLWFGMDEKFSNSKIIWPFRTHCHKKRKIISLYFRK